jgi:hypothetical protein
VVDSLVRYDNDMMPIHHKHANQAPVQSEVWETTVNWTYLIPCHGEEVLGQLFQEPPLQHADPVWQGQDESAALPARVAKDELHNFAVGEYC